MTLFFRIPTRHGHILAEATSAFQKSIRRGIIDDAIYWGVEIDCADQAEHAWKRMFIIASEDIGPAEPNLPANLHALYESWQRAKAKRDSKHHPERLFFVHAIMLLALAKKSRVVDHALIVHYNDPKKRPVPDYALDKHTARGKKLGRGMTHFFDEGAKLANVDDEIPDVYEAGAREALGADPADEERASHRKHYNIDDHEEARDLAAKRRNHTKRIAPREHPGQRSMAFGPDYE